MKDNIRLWLIKIVLAVVIFFIAAILGSLMKSPGQSSSPWAGAIAGAAILALIAWKPAKRNASTDIEVKPLDKRDDDSSI